MLTETLYACSTAFSGHIGSEVVFYSSHALADVLLLTSIVMKVTNAARLFVY